MNGIAPTPDPRTTATAHRRLWRTAGALLIGYLVLTFAGVVFEHTLMLGDGRSEASDALVRSSMAKNFAGGYVELLATLLLLVGAQLLARLLRGESETSAWLSSCISAGAIVYAAVTIVGGFAAGAAALYDGHHGAALATAITVNDIRNFSFFLSGAALAVLAFGVVAASWVTGLLPRWVSYTGAVAAVLWVATIPAARTGVINIATLLGFAWILALAIAALRAPGRTVVREAVQPVAAMA